MNPEDDRFYCQHSLKDGVDGIEERFYFPERCLSNAIHPNWRICSREGFVPNHDSCGEMLFGRDLVGRRLRILSDLRKTSEFNTRQQVHIHRHLMVLPNDLIAQLWTWYVLCSSGPVFPHLSGGKLPSPQIKSAIDFLLNVFRITSLLELKSLPTPDQSSGKKKKKKSTNICLRIEIYIHQYHYLLARHQSMVLG